MVVVSSLNVKHAASNPNLLVELIKVEEKSCIVMNHIGRYYESIIRKLTQADLFISAVNTLIVHCILAF